MTAGGLTRAKSYGTPWFSAEIVLARPVQSRSVTQRQQRTRRLDMKTSTKKTSLSIKTTVKAGGISMNHNRLAVRSTVKAGGISMNHNRLAVRSTVKAGGISMNHN